jgi:hypothetical protein
MTWHNILLDNGFNLKLADLADSYSMDLMFSLIAVTRVIDIVGTVCADGGLFAFGPALYQLLTETPPYDTLCEEDISAQYSTGILFETASLEAFGRGIIESCWRGQYSGCKFVF